MKQRLNICHLYLLVCLLCAITGGFVNKVAQGILILMSLYYAVYANFKYKLPVYFKVLNVLLIMFTIYGVLLLISGEQLIVKSTYWEIAKTEFLKRIYKSLLPVYSFYVFTKQGLLKESTIKFWFFIFLLSTIGLFYKSQERMLLEAVARGSSAKEFTNNMGYTFLALLPALVFFYKKPIIQYLGLVVCAYFMVIAMKRGAILIGIVCLIWFMVTNLKRVSKKRKWIVILVSLAVVFAGIYLYYYMIETSTYFRYRITQIEEGDSSGRDELFSVFYEHFIHEEHPLRFLFGYGAEATLKIGENNAHNDWLEIATNQGLLGIVVYLAYWISFYISWRRAKWHPQAFMSIGMLFFIYLLSTLFSMSYSSVSRCAAMVLGYALAISFETTNQEVKTELLPKNEALGDVCPVVNNQS